MKKSLLLQIPTERIDNKAFKLPKIKFILKAQKLLVDDTETLVVDVFERNCHQVDEDLDWKVRLFAQESNHCTLVRDGENGLRWSGATLGHLVYEVLRDDENYSTYDPTTTDVVKSFFHRDWDISSLPRIIQGVQQQQLDARRNKEHQKEKDRIDERLQVIPKLPNDFEEWVNEKALFDSRYIYYKYERKKHMNGFCTYCKEHLKVTKPKHNEKGICPKCQSRITYKAINKAAAVDDRVEASLIQKLELGYVIRYFWVRRKIVDYLSPFTQVDEKVRVFYAEDSMFEDSYEVGNFKQTDEYRWCELGCDVSHLKETILYPNNLDDFTSKTDYRFSAIRQLAENKPNFKFCVKEYLREYEETPALEYLVKLGFYRIAKDLRIGYEKKLFNLKGKKMNEVIPFDKNYIPFIRKNDLNLEEAKIFVESKNLGKKLTLDQIKFIAKIAAFKALKNMWEYISVGESLRYLKNQQKLLEQEREEEEANTVRRQYGYSSYVPSLGSICRDWLDYLDECKMLKYELNTYVLFPRNLRENHTETSALCREIKNKKLAAKRRELNKKSVSVLNSYRKAYEWETEGYSVIVPKSTSNLKTEGQKLQHCVGGHGYIERVVNKETIILFLRKSQAIKDPFYTIEVKNGKIVQCRGLRNANKTEEVSRVIAKYEKEVLAKLVKTKTTKRGKTA